MQHPERAGEVDLLGGLVGLERLLFQEQLHLHGARLRVREIRRLVEMPRRDVRVHELVVVVQEYRLDTVHVFERGRVTELEQAVRLLVQKQRGRLGLLVNLFLFPVNGLLHVFLERGPVLVERFLREEYFVLDVAETQERQDGCGEYDSPGKQRKEQEVVFGELDSHAASLQGEARRYAWE